jgi:hypothetical protein
MPGKHQTHQAEAPRAAAAYEKPEVERQQKLAEVTGQQVSGSAPF